MCTPGLWQIVGDGVLGADVDKGSGRGMFDVHVTWPEAKRLSEMGVFCADRQLGLDGWFSGGVWRRHKRDETTDDDSQRYIYRHHNQGKLFFSSRLLPVITCFSTVLTLFSIFIALLSPSCHVLSIRRQSNIQIRRDVDSFAVSCDKISCSFLSLLYDVLNVYCDILLTFSLKYSRMWGE